MLYGFTDLVGVKHGEKTLIVGLVNAKTSENLRLPSRINDSEYLP
jgi:hypothetical protein